MIATLVEQLETAGAVMHVDAGDLVVKAPGLTATDVDQIRANKPAIISFLADRRPPCNPEWVCSRRLIGNGFPPYPPSPKPPASIIDTSVYCRCGNKVLPELRTITAGVCWPCHQRQGATP